MFLYCECNRSFGCYCVLCYLLYFFFFFFNDTATTEIYTLSLHDALPISRRSWRGRRARTARPSKRATIARSSDRKSTRLNSSHSQISYAVFCLKKKNTNGHSAAGGGNITSQSIRD